MSYIALSVVFAVQLKCIYIYVFVRVVEFPFSLYSKNFTTLQIYLALLNSGDPTA